MIDAEKAALLADIRAWSGAEHQREGDLTIQDVMGELGLGHQAALRHLRRLVADGKLAEHQVTLGTHKRGYVYRRAEGD